MLEGVSTPVYRLRVDGRTLYLRGAEVPGESLAPEVEVHERLRAMGARVPEVVHFVEADGHLARSAMVVAEIGGAPIEWDPIQPEPLRAAGRDIARISSIAIEGFGWVRRDVGRSLEGGNVSYEDFAHGIVRDRFDGVTAMIGVEAAGALAKLMDADVSPTQPQVAHGDLDGSHVYAQEGSYTGLIDFGELMGAAWYHDLAHFFLHHDDGVKPLLEGFVEGGMDEPSADQLRTTAVLIGAKRVAYAIKRHGEAAKDAVAPKWYARRVASLLAG